MSFQHQNKKIHLFRWPAYALFFSMLALPIEYKYIQIVLIAITVLFICFNIAIRQHIKLHKSVFEIAMIMLVTGACFALWGGCNDAPGALPMSKIYILYPTIYLFFIIGMTDKILNQLVKIMMIATIFIGVYGILYLLHELRYLPDCLFINLMSTQRIGLHEGYSKYITYSITSLVFIIPFIIASLLTWPKHLPPISFKWLWTAFFFGSIIMLISFRRALFLVVLFSPFIAYFLCKFSTIRIDKKNFRLMAIIICFIISTFILNLFFPLRLSIIMQRMAEGFNSNIDNGALIRKEQFYALLGEWEKRPLFGSGLGSKCKKLIRNDESPWSYELVYMAMLQNIGLIGIFIYLCSILWILKTGIHIIKTDNNLRFYMISTLTGLICVLIANISNPYLNNFSFLYPIFLPVAIINLHKLKKHSQNHNLTENTIMACHPELSTSQIN